MSKNKLRHIAFILDGNKRWAKKKKLSDLEGYKKGFENIKHIVNHALDIKIKNVTLFTLSSENFKRPSLNIIYDLIYNNFSNFIDELITKRNVKVKIFGSRNNLPSRINKIFDKAERISADNEKLYLNLAFNYGFKEEIQEVLKKFKNGIKEINIEDEQDIRKLFYLNNQSDPEILVRTGGYNRLSNFIMYNLTYTELFFSKTLWPEFSTDELDQIIKDFFNIKRTYGL